jgi:hypothetical protein
MDNMDTSNKMSIYSLVKPNFDLSPSTKDGDGAKQTYIQLHSNNTK